MFYHHSDILIQLVRSHELLYCQVHAVSPIVTWIGWNVYALSIGIGQPKLLVCGKPVLK